MIKTIVACSSILFITSLSANAQSNKSPERNLKFKIYTWFDIRRHAKDQKNIGEKLFYKKSYDKFEPVLLRRSEASPQYTTKIAKSALTLYREVIDEEGEVSYIPALRGKIPSTATEVFSFFFPTPKPSLYNIDTSKRVFPMSSFLFINRQKRDVVVRINGNTKLVKAMEKKLFSYKLDKKLLLRVDVRDPRKKAASSLIGQTVGGKKGQRIIGFFYGSKNNTNRLFMQREVDDQSIKVSRGKR